MSPLTGVVDITKATAVMGAATYTITATPTGVGYSGTKEATISIEVTALSIATNDFSYADTSVSFGTEKTVAPNKNFAVAAGVKYTIKGGTTNLPTGMQLDPDNGEISIEATAAVQAVKTYQIVATPTDASYTGVKEATAKIKVSSATDEDISAYDLNYIDLAVEQGATGEVSPTGTIPRGASVGYALQTGTFPDGITMEAATGKRSVAATAVAQTKTAYMIEATATGTGYTGTKEARVNITVAGKDISIYNFSYENTVVERGTGGSVDTEGDIPTAANVSYAIKTGTFLTGISLSPTTGKITILGTTAALAETPYVIVATPDGAGTYTGTKESTVKITVIAAQNKDLSTYDFSYAEKSVPQGTASEVAPTATFPAPANVSYALK
ncbi:MAG: hypothetical protein KAG66_14925, partial [Methylococcales bacterium]|nr:hypothetical protein [Methylococcales bacterium]